MRDALGPLIVELRAYLAGTAFSATEVRGGQLAGNDKPPVVLFTHVVRVTEPGSPTLHQRVQATTYGVTPQQASELNMLVADCFNDRAGRVQSHTGILASWEDSGGQPVSEPLTGWPGELSFITAYVMADAIA